MRLPAAAPQRRAVTASAARLKGGDQTQNTQRILQPWQFRALGYYDQIGEINFACDFYAKMLSRIRLFPATLEEDGTLNKIESGRPVELLTRVQDPGGKRSQLQFDYGRLKFITGEGVLFVSGEDTDEEKWRFLWKDEVKIRSSGTAVRLDWQRKETGETGTAYRMWTPHPRQSDLATSPMRAVLDICEELIILTQAVRGTATSRLTNGILALASELSPSPADGGADEDPLENPFLAAYIEHVQAQIENPGAPEGKVPFLLEGAFDYIQEGVKWIQTHDPATDYMEKDLRIEAVKRLALGLDFPPEALLGMTEANHWCQVSQTEILAKGKGWISHEELAVGDHVLTLNHETGESEWQPVQDIYRADVEAEPMYRMESRSHSSISTPAHRWPIVKTGYKVSGSRRRWTTSADGFAATDRVPVAAWLNDEKEDRYDDDFVRLIVAYTADGTNQEHGNIRIAKFSDREIVEMRRILTALYGPGGFREHSHPTHSADGTAFVLRQKEARQLLELCDERRAITISFVDDLTSEQRLLFLASCAEIGDGVERDGAGTLYQVEPARLEAFAYAAHLSGLKVTYGKRKQQTGYGTEPLSWIRWSCSTDTFAPASCKETVEAYTGTIWCPVTKNQTWLARHNGNAYFTGNTALQISQDRWQSYGSLVAEDWVHDLAQAYLRPALRDEDYTGWEDVVIGFDASQVVVNPDRSADADAALDRIAIGFEGYRKLKGIDETFAPDEDEKQFMAAIKLRDPALLGLEDQGMLPVNARGPAQPAAETDNSPGVPPAPSNGRVVSRQEAMTAAVVGAAHMALLRCRSQAGAKLRQIAARNKKACPDCTGDLDGVPNALAASVMGSERMAAINRTDHAELVKGGTGEFADLLASWGVGSEDAKGLCARLEFYAAKTLLDDKQPDLPPGFAAQVEQAFESMEAAA